VSAARTAATTGSASAARTAAAATPKLDLRTLNRATLARQGLLERLVADVPSAIGRLAGLQAQHANSPYIALWSRVRDLGIADVEAALMDRTVVKATVMRSTLHLVAAADYPAFDVASSQARVANWRATAERAGFDPADLNRRLLAYASQPRTVAELEAFLDAFAPDAVLGDQAPGGVRHASFRLASTGGGLVHVPPSGLWRSHGQARYIAGSRWLPESRWPSPEEALVLAVERYLTAYGPASVADIGKWVGQPRLPRVRTALATLGERVRAMSGPDGRELVDLPGLALPDPETAAPARFLARWDSVLIGYDVRDRILPDAYREAVVRKNGDFLPSFLVDGFVAGLWAPDRTGVTATITLTPFATLGRAERRALADEAERLIRFIEPDARAHEVRWATG
jgi:hypothetical protein